ncbi:MAG: C_GCAxxG_C_C family protein [Oscillospiraceae bacterium]|nr:C_GCAxxG_C_C family protein [Oscillospiraceae bacterium]
MTAMEKARALRGDTNVHYNCCQSVLIPFAEKLGLTPEQANALGAHFGSGMRHGATCGALAGALMAIGLAKGNSAAAIALLAQFKQKNGCTDCIGLLNAARERGQVKKDNCDELVYQCVAFLEELLNEPAD